ncbi:MAG: extracellular solute-binding protein [Halanaerobiales bacterium]
MCESKLKIWLIITSNEHEVLRFLKDKFCHFQIKNNVGIQLKLITWNRAFEALIKAYKNDTAPDIIQVGTTWVRTLAYMGYIAPVPANLAVKESFSSNMNKVCIFKDRQYAVPWIIETIILAARKDYMDKYNVNLADLKNLDGLYNTCKKLVYQRKENQEIPKLLAFSLKAENDTLHRFFALLWARGWKFPELYGSPSILTDPVVMENISYLVDLMQVSRVTRADMEKHPYELNEEFYRQGGYFFYIGSWYGIVEDISKNTKDSREGNFRYTVLPFPNNHNQSSSYGGGSALVVSSQCRNKEKAWQLVQFLIRDEFINDWIKVTGKVPAFDSQFWAQRANDERINTMYQQTLNAITYPPHPAWTTIEDIMTKGIVQSLWKLIEKGSSEIDKEVYSLLENTDKSIEELLSMSWEMKVDD